MHDFDTQDLKRRFDIPAATIRFLVRTGHLKPRRRAGKLVFSFQDLVVLRSVNALRAASIPAYKINRALKQLGTARFAPRPLSGQALMALGNRIGVRDGRRLWEPESGQYQLAFEPPPDTRVSGLPPTDGQAQSRDAAAGHYARAVALEEADPTAAIPAYENCLRLDPDHVHARINLGRILHLNGRLTEAELVYGGVPVSDATLAFNLGVLFEDLEREIDALLAYREAIALDPGFADAHFNVAKLHERLGNLRESFQHLVAYQRLKDRQNRDR